MTGRGDEGDDPPETSAAELLAALIVDVPDFPQHGVVFKDITPLIGSAQGLAAAIEGLVEAAPADVDLVLGMEARGFIFGAPVAYGISVGFVPVRKPGKLPRDTFSVTYDLEYGSDTIAVHADAIPPGARVLIVDDVLATGGTVAACGDLVRRLDAEVVGVLVVAELAFLNPRARLAAHGLHEVTSLVRIEAP
jgi:adenine phosphoribosyltransferase